MKLNKNLFYYQKVLEFILDPGEYNKEKDNRKKLESQCCNICPLKIECIVGDIIHGNDPQLLPNINVGPLIYCFPKKKL